MKIERNTEPVDKRFAPPRSRETKRASNRHWGEATLMWIEGAAAVLTACYGVLAFVSSFGAREPFGLVIGPIFVACGAIVGLPAIALWRRWERRWLYQLIIVGGLVVILFIGLI